MSLCIVIRKIKNKYIGHKICVTCEVCKIQNSNYSVLGLFAEPKGTDPIQGMLFGLQEIIWAILQILYLF